MEKRESQTQEDQAKALADGTVAAGMPVDEATDLAATLATEASDGASAELSEEFLYEFADKLAPSLSASMKQFLCELQQSMVTQAAAYRKMAQSLKEEGNRRTLQRIADEIDAQAQAWGRCTGEAFTPDQRKVRKYARISKLFGFTFAVRLMDQRKVRLVEHSQGLMQQAPQVALLEQAEAARDQRLFSLLEEKRLGYVGAMILGMNDAIVEITGTLAGLTLAMQNTRLIALSGLITGIAATLSMAASEYLAEKTNGKPDAKQSALYTGVTYFATVVVLLLPYLLLDDQLYLLAMGIMLALVVVILALFNVYTAVTQGTSFKRSFGQMCAISLGVAALSFVLGLAVKVFLGVDV